MVRAVVAREYGGPEVLELAEVPSSRPGIGEVTVAVRAAGVNPSDGKTIAGAFGRSASPPLRVGSEVSGVITEVGDDAGAFAEGDEVVAYRISGGWADEVTVAARSVFAKPAGVGFDEAAGLLLTGTTAWHLLEATRVTEGDVVLIHGASGSVGSLAAQLALARGARVIGTAGPTRIEQLHRRGIDAVPYGEGLEQRVRDLGVDVDVALDTVGTDEAVDVSVALVPDRTRIATIAAFDRGAEAGILRLGGGPGADRGTDVRNAARPRLLQLAADGVLTVDLGPAFPLERARDAVELVMSGHPGGKVVLHP